MLKTHPVSDYFFDVEFDKDLIESSLAMQYNVRLRHEPDISYAEWMRLVNGIMPETPLGRIIGIRAEKDKDTLKSFGENEKKIRSDWQKFKIKNNKQPNVATKQDLENLKKMFEKIFEKKK